MKILVTGGAGFIGSNFIRHILGLGRGYSVVNYDKLTYAGNLANLDSVAGDPHYRFVKGDICDAAAVGRGHERAVTRWCTSRLNPTWTAASMSRSRRHRDQRKGNVYFAAGGAETKRAAIRSYFHR